MKTYFEGEIIDGRNHSFTSNLSANCEVLDVYFWNRFPAFKDITSMKQLKNESPNHIYMRWEEKGTMKQMPQKKSLKRKQSNISSNPESECDYATQSDDEEMPESLEYLDSKVDDSDPTNELNANGSYFICLDLQ